MMSTFWSIWITVIALGSLIGSFLLLRWCMKDKMGVEEGESMGHKFDGIEELNNPLPKWWSYMFIMTVVFALVYLALYPGLGNFGGLLGWKSANKNIQTLEESRQQADNMNVQYNREVKAADQVFGEVFRELVYRDGQYREISELAYDDQAIKVGQRLFLQNCAQCHGSDGRGSRGFPNLTDDDWLWGGATAQIKTTIMQGRQAAMPAWGDSLGEEGVKEIVSYVLSLSGRKVNDIEAAAGQQRFAVCAACHGLEGKGNPAMGAPNLTDNTWLYGGSRMTVEQTVATGRNGMMPAWSERLGEDKVHLLAAYVYRLSHPEKP